MITLLAGQRQTAEFRNETVSESRNGLVAMLLAQLAMIE
jgi:hypothetical protein